MVLGNHIVRYTDRISSSMQEGYGHHFGNDDTIHSVSLPVKYWILLWRYHSWKVVCLCGIQEFNHNCLLSLSNCWGVLPFPSFRQFTTVQTWEVHQSFCNFKTDGRTIKCTLYDRISHTFLEVHLSTQSKSCPRSIACFANIIPIIKHT
jgi:hypothetical protein